MSVTPSQFRLGPDTLADLDALAASNGGQRTAALKESVAQWHAAVAEAGRLNADELSVEDWTRLAHLNDPDPFAGAVEGDSLSPLARDWSRYLALELAGMYEGRELVLESQRIEAEECRELAGRVADMGRVRGYALMAALRYFWRTSDAGIGAFVAPEVWLTPTAKG